MYVCMYTLMSEDTSGYWFSVCMYVYVCMYVDMNENKQFLCMNVCMYVCMGEPVGCVCSPGCDGR